MIGGLLGKKLGMTQIWDDSEVLRPATVIEVGPCVVLQVKTTEREGYRVSSIVRRRIEGILGWTKTTGNLRKTRYCGREKTDLWAKMTGAAYDLLRMARLLAAPT